MLRAYILTAILRKELTEALREKHLRMVLVVGMLFPLFFGWTSIKAEAERNEPERARQADAAAPAGAAVATAYGHRAVSTDNQDAPKTVGAFSLVMSVGYGMFLAAIFAITLALESFVGEKERNTMETLLGTPATDRELFLSKMISCLLISTALGIVFGFAGSIGLAGLAKLYNLAMPWPLLGRIWGCALALLLAVSLTCASVGVIISSRVSTVKAGGQMFGAVMLVLVVAFMVGGLLLEPHQESVKDVIAVLIHMPPWTLVVLPLLVAVLLNWGLLSLAARAFGRERILTGR